MHISTRTLVTASATILAATACASRGPATEQQRGGGAAVRPGITVLLEDSLHLIRGKRIGLITNQSGLDEHGRTSIDLLFDERARAAGVTLVRLYAPEHGIRGTEDGGRIEDEVDQKTGLLVVSLYRGGTRPPADSMLQDLDALVIDLQDIGTRTWTYVGVMLYSMQSSARLGLPVLVLDRPNPIGGDWASAPLLDTARANPFPGEPGRPGRAFALYPTALRHGLTMGEMARYFNHEMNIRARLTVVPMSGWRRDMWYDQTGLPWVKPSPNMPDVMSALFYPALVAFEGSNVSVGRGTPDAFQRFGASWLDAHRVARMLSERNIPGVRFVVDSFTPRAPSDRKFAERHIPGILIQATDRNRVPVGLVGASILWALSSVHADSLRVTPGTYDDRFGSTWAREALVRGEDPAAVMARLQPAVDDYKRRTDPHKIYR